MQPKIKILNEEFLEEQMHHLFIQDLTNALECYVENYDFEEYTIHVTKYKHHVEINDMNVWGFDGERKICSLFWDSKILVFSEGRKIKLYVTRRNNEACLSVGINGAFKELRTFIRKYVNFEEGKYSEFAFYD